MSDLKVIVLAAGKGTRMMSEAANLPKVMRQALGKPLLHYVLSALDFVDPADTVLVTGFLSETVRAAFPAYPAALQQPQLGTGHAVQCARQYLEGFQGTVLVCYGDMPLLRRETYQSLLEAHRASGAACTLLSGTSDLDLPYGRVMQDAAGNFLGVVEDRDCTPEQKQIPDLNVGIYCFENDYLLPALDGLQSNNAQHEYYLTETPELMLRRGMRVETFRIDDGEALRGVNTPEDLAVCDRILAAAT